MCARGPKSCAGRARRRAHTEITLGTVISMVPRVVPGRLQECPSLKSQMELGGQKRATLGQFWGARAGGARGRAAQGTHTCRRKERRTRDGREKRESRRTRRALDCDYATALRALKESYRPMHTDVCTRQIVHSRNQTTRCSPGEPSFVSRVPYYATVCCVHFKTGSTTRRWSRSRATAAAHSPRQRRAARSLDGAGASAAAAARGCRIW